MNHKGGLNWFNIMMAPVLVILLIAIFPVLDVVLTEAFTALDATSTTLFVNLIKLLLGSIGFILVIGIIWTTVSSLNEPDYRQQ